MYALTRTPLGRMCNAVRDNPERANSSATTRTRALHRASASPASSPASPAASPRSITRSSTRPSVGAQQSGTCCSWPIIGGVGYFIGPMLGAVLVTWLQIMLCRLHQAWLLYFGLLFIAVVLFAPGGIAGLVMMHAPLRARARAAAARAAAYAARAAGRARCAARRRRRRSRWRTIARRGSRGHRRCACSASRWTPRAPGRGWSRSRSRGRRTCAVRARPWPRAHAAWDDALDAAQAQAKRAMSTPAIELADVHKSFGATQIIRGVDLESARRAPRDHRPQRRRKIDPVQPHQRPAGPEPGTIGLNGENVTGLAPYRSTGAASSRSFQVTNIFPRLIGLREHALRRAVVARLPVRVLARRRRPCRRARARPSRC